MSGTIQINEAEFDAKKLMCSGCEQALLSGEARFPSVSGSAPAMEAFMSKLTELGSVINAYKSVLQADVAALESVKSSLAEADKAVSGNF